MLEQSTNITMLNGHYFKRCRKYAVNGVTRAFHYFTKEVELGGRKEEHKSPGGKGIHFDNRLAH